MAAKNNPVGPTSRRRENTNVSRRQEQKRLKKEVDDLFLHIDVDDDNWLGGGSSMQVDDAAARVDLSQHSASESDTACAAAALDDQGNSPSTSSASSDCSDAPLSDSGEVGLQPTWLADLFDDLSGSSDEEVVKDDHGLCHALRKWYVTSKVNLKQLNLLLDTLQPFHPSLPKDARTVVHTPRSTDVKKLSNGDYVHLGFRKALLNRLPSGTKQSGVTRLNIDINIDGMSSVSKSSNVDVWPILGRCIDIVQDKPFAIGIFSGSSKPHPREDFFADFIEEALDLLAQGVDFDDKHYDIHIGKFLCDAPARAYCKCITGHCGKDGCERCRQVGEHDGVRVIFETQVAAPRTNEAFRNQDDKHHHHKDVISPLAVLPIDFISDFPLDPMHLVYHGVFKRFMQFLFGKEVNNAKLSAKEFAYLSVCFEKLSECIPKEFQRIIARPLTLFARWKATEHRLFLLYLGIVALLHVLTKEKQAVYKIFLHLHVAIRILSSPRLVADQDYVDFAEKLLSVFVKCCAKKSVFGPGFVTYNVHSVLHLCDDSRNFGDLMNFSCFVFENHLGVLRRLVRSGVKVAQQLAHRLAEIDAVVEEQQESFTDPFSLCPSGYDIFLQEYSVLSCQAYSLVPKSSRDGFFMVGNDCLGYLKSICKDSSGRVKIFADLCKNLSDFYTKPLESSQVGVFKFDDWTDRNVCVDLGTINGKVMVLPYNNSKIAIRLLHTYN